MQRYRINPDIRIVPSEDGRSFYRASVNGRFFALESWAFEFLHLLDDVEASKLTTAFEDCSNSLGIETGALRETFDHFVSCGLLVSDGHRGFGSEGQPHHEDDLHVLSTMTSLTAKKGFLKAEAAQKIGLLTSRFFKGRRPVFLLLASSAVLLIAAAYSVSEFGLLVDPSATVYCTAIGLPLFILLRFPIGLIHESGHLGACVSCGKDPGEMGIGVYLTSLALYVDMNDANIADRKSRLIIDAGGIILELVFDSLFAIVALSTRNPILLNIVLALLLGIISNLNPIVKTDGYWLCSDYLDLPNLHNRIEEIWSSCVTARSFRPLANSNRQMKIFLIAWLSLLLLALIAAVLLLPSYVSEYPLIFLGYFEDLRTAADASSAAQFFFNIYLIIGACIPVAGVLILIYKALRLILRRRRS